MPYRRLPNTDIARFKALKIALEKGRELPPFKLAFSQQSLQKLKAFFPEYERAFKQLNESKAAQLANRKRHSLYIKKARVYISHFIQVLNFSIMRGELLPKARSFYGIIETDCKVPVLNTENQIIQWGEKIITGEPERIANGGNPVTNPTIAVVKVHFDHFIDAYRQQNTLIEHYKRASDKVNTMRIDADLIILNIWNEVENFYAEHPEEQKSSSPIDYGLIYFLRKGEVELAENEREVQNIKIFKAKKESNKGQSPSNDNLQYSLLLFVD
ncbi:MAG: hypothetical protein ABIJ97_10765 [Bacteroidota bacterium]